MRSLRMLGVSATVVALLAAAACGGESLEDSGDEGNGSGGDTGSGGDKGSLTVSGQNFTEMEIMAEMYSQVLENAGYDVTIKLVTTRDVYIKEMKAGKVDVVPEYLAGITDQLQAQVNGEDAPIVSSNSVDETLAALEELAPEYGITMLEPSEATDQNAYAVTQEYADENDLTTLSDLGALGEPIKLAAHADCEGRDDCEKGLREVYGIDIEEVVPLGFGTSQTKDALAEGEVQLGQTGTTDGSLEDLGLVLLEDDKGLQPAQNLIPAVRTEFLDENPDVAEVLNELSATLTTDQLADLNAAVDINREKAEDVAAGYLEEQGLV
jgi:osmoprotectant transport system substrate-binding protein